MIYTEVQQDLFTVHNDFHLAHFISADAKMDTGVAIEFKNRFNLSQLQKTAIQEPLQVGSCVKVGRVLNLVTKRQHWSKTTYVSLRKSLESMRRMAEKQGIKKIALTMVDAGLDRLKWSEVGEILKYVFSDTDIEIVVCTR